MNIQQANPSLKAFLFFLLVFISGIFSLGLALFFENVFQGVKQEKIIPMKSSSNEVLKASLGFDFISDSGPSVNAPTATSSLSGTLIPPSKAVISLISISKEDTIRTNVLEHGQFQIKEILGGDYEIVIEPSKESGLQKKTIDAVSIQSGISKNIGVLELFQDELN